MPTLFIPIEMRKLTAGVDKVQVDGLTLRDAVAELDQRYPGMREAVFADDWMRPGVAAVIDGEQTVDGPRTKLREDSEVHFLRPIAGGA